MTDNIKVQIVEPPTYTLQIETQVGVEPINVSVLSYSGTNISITHDLPVLSPEIDDHIASLLVAGSGINLYYNDSIPSITISATGLQPSGNYANAIHSHNISDINNFNNGVSGLLPSVSGDGYVISSFSNNIYTISITGVQPSGNYSVHGHTHNSSQITDFNTSVSGLLPVKNLTSGSGIEISSSSGNFVISVTGTFGLTNEEVDDRVNSLLVAGSYTNLNYDDNANILSISVTGLQPSGSYANTIHNHISSDITDLNNSVSGLLPSITGSNYITSNFANNIYTISVTGLQPSGNYSSVGHTHISSEITNFNSSVSGLIDGIYATIDSPHLTGIPTAPTAPSGTNTTQIANTIFVRNEISNLVASAPATLDTLNELAQALGNDPNFATTVTNSLASKAALNGAVFTGSVTIPSGTGNFNSLTVNNINVSLSGHLHSTSDITNFSSEVSGLLPNITGINYITSNFINNTYSIGVTGLQPSGNYSIVGHSHIIADVSGLQIALDNKQPSGIYASGIHYHTSSDITDFNTSISGLLPTINGNGYVNTSFNNNIYTISVSGLQPSGDYSVVGHSHPSSDITDFSSSVSGLLPVKDIISGTGISISSSSGIYTINSTINEVERASSLVTTVFNKTGSQIPKFSVVYINGGQGDQPTIALAIASGENTSSKTYGITYENIDHMSTGRVVVEGALTGVNTDQFNPTAPVGDVNGTVLYLSPSTSGAVTTTKPSAPNHLVAVGTIVRTHQNAGVVEVRIQNGFELQELHNVAISGVTNGQFLQYNSSNGLWIPSSSGNFSSLLVNGTGVSVSGHAHTSSDITDFNSSVSGLLPVTNILGGSNITVSQSGTNFTVAVTGSLGLTTEEVDDRISNLLVAGTGISLDYNDGLDTLTINTSGLQPSGNYSIVGHSHSSADISDFNTSVSGLLPTISNSGDNRLLTSTGSSVGVNAENNLTFDGSFLNVVGSGNFDNIFISGIALNEVIDDEIATLLVAGSGINLNYNDNSNTLTVDTSANTSLISGTGIALNYNAITDELSINSTTSIVGGTNISVVSSGTAYTIATSGLITGTKTYGMFTTMQNQPPASGFATLDTRNSIAVLDFDAATKESAVFVGIMPDGAVLSSGVNINLYWMATTATSGNVVWEVSLENSNTDLNTDSFDAVASGIATTSATAGIISKTSIALTTIDSVNAGDLYRLKVSRDAANGSDTMTGDAEFVAVEVRGVA